MLIQPYSIDELTFAWSHRVCFLFQSYRRRANKKLLELDRDTFCKILDPYPINVLEYGGDDIRLRLFTSLRPDEAVAVAASKIKGRVSKWLNQKTACPSPEKMLGLGYFAASTGKSTSRNINAYLDKQSAHHGYSDRAHPPIFIRQFEKPRDNPVLKAQHAVTDLRYHIVLATERRRGVFTEAAGDRVSRHWKEQEAASRVEIIKVSFLPDHVHIALAMHPGCSPAKIVLMLMNSSQHLMWQDFEGLVIQSKVCRLWQPSAYLGTFGDLTSSAMSSYVKNWGQPFGGAI